MGLSKMCQINQSCFHRVHFLISPGKILVREATVAKMKWQTHQPFSFGKSVTPPPPPVLMKVNDSVNRQNLVNFFFFKEFIELKASGSYFAFN